MRSTRPLVSPGPLSTLDCLSTVIMIMCLLPAVRAYHSAYWSYCMLCLPVCTFLRRVAFRFPLQPQSYYPPLNSSLSLMSHNQSSSKLSNFQLIFDNALKTYKKSTKNDLLKHPLADRIQACDSPSSILNVLQEQVQELNESKHSNTKWLDPTVNVLHTFSGTIGEGVGLVCFRI